jgi:transposase
MKRRPPEVEVPEADRAVLMGWGRSRNAPHKLATRARIVLLAQDGLGPDAIAAALGTSRETARDWRDRYIEGGMEALEDREGRGRKPSLDPAVLTRIVTEATRPPAPRRRWSCRTMAKALGVGKSTVQTVWAANDIRPHRVENFKISKDPRFEEKFWDVIGLYLHPPEKAIVLCCDEKTQCQALERTQPGLPLGMGHIRTRTHDYYRHGTIALFAALNYIEGKVIHCTAARHTHREWLRFLKQIADETPKGVDLHLILDNYSTHKDARVTAWLQRHPRFHLHFTPTSSSWLNLVERFFRDISQDVIREGSFASTGELTEAILMYMVQRNQAPRRYVWRADGQKILEKIRRARQRLEQVKNNA